MVECVSVREAERVGACEPCVRARGCAEQSGASSVCEREVVAVGTDARGERRERVEWVVAERTSVGASVVGWWAGVESVGVLEVVSASGEGGE